MKTKRTYFTRKDLVSFGRYLLSEEREKMMKHLRTLQPKMAAYEDCFRDVSHADVENWKSTQGWEEIVDK